MCGFLLWALCACLALAEVNITANIDVNTTWFADTAYNLNAQVTVLAGATLTIQPGTTIRGKRNGVDGRASALIISRGARIIARGTSSSPITFTAQEAVSAGNMRGLWGGLVIAGYAVVNGEERFVEGLTDVLYGGSNNEDDSGVLQYVRIWHGGADIGANPDPNEGSGDEINGLTLAGVGSRTIVEHVEVAYNLDDGFEMFGGTVNLKWCSSLFNQDDAFDADLGYQGKMQFLFALVDQDGHHAAEIDGNMNVQPRSFPTVYGATFMKATNTDATALVKIREGSGGEFHNMILEGYAGFGLRNEECGNETQSSVTRGTSPNYLFWSSNNIVSTQNVMGSIAQFNISAPCSWAAQSRSVDSQLTLHPNVWREPKSLRMIDPRPQPGGNAFSGSSTPPNDGFFLETNYVGAFSDTELWLDGWSWLSENGFLPAGDVQVTPDNRLCGNYTTSRTLSSGVTYYLTCQTFVKSPAVLTIEAGTTIKAYRQDEDGRAPTLVIEQGAKIIAQGSSAKPITFTSVLPSSVLPQRGTWGGLILLGKGIIAGGGTRFIEGIDGGAYGGTDNEDDSGVLSYVRVWYGGADVGDNSNGDSENSGIEINGITFGAVGSRTVVDHCEVAFNLDDGFEAFGGAVNLKHCSSIFNGDDAFDTDEGYRGKMQFLFAIVDGAGNHAAEMDGNEDVQPRSFPQVNGATFLKAAQPGFGDGLMRLREGTGGEYYNIVLLGRAGAGMENKMCFSETKSSSGNGSDPNYLFWDRRNVINTLTQGGQPVDFDIGSSCNWENGPESSLVPMNLQLLPEGWSTYEDLVQIDPRPTSNSPTDTAQIEDSFFSQAAYPGGFPDSSMWLDSWSWLSENGMVPAADVNPSPSTTLCGAIETSMTIHSSETYYLTCQAFVKAPNILTIERGATIRAYARDKDGAAPALTIERGAKIMAQGSPTQPITMTNVLHSATLPRRKTWGGLIVLGAAPISGGENSVEGLPSDLGLYGGTDPTDSSGVLQYVRVWYGGADIELNVDSRENSGNEINGITLAGVGNGTIVEHCEVAWNHDDGFEMFGGTVNLKWCSSVYNKDDAFDTDEGYQGKMQFLFALVDKDGHHAAEMDSKTNGNIDSQPRSYPRLYGATFIKASHTSGDGLMKLREGTAGEFGNIILAGEAEWGVQHEDCGGERHSSIAPSFPDTLFFSNNNIINTVSSDGDTDTFTQTDGCAWDAFPNPRIVDSHLLLLPASWESTIAQIDPRPRQNSHAFLRSRVDSVPSNDNFFSSAPFVGGFGSDLWISEWTYLAETGRLPANEYPTTETTLCGRISESKRLVASRTYYMTCQVFVEPGQTLTIEAGTTIKSYMHDKNGEATALIIEKGAKIIAAGTASQPITFTSVLPQKELPKRGTWGGVIILGNATINTISGSNTIEGVRAPDGEYGGADDDDNSGTLRYVRIWYGGADISPDPSNPENSGNEINGLTLGGVGAGTTVEYCEVAYNLDDGFEAFGGTVSLRFCSSVFNGDDQFDFDEGYRGQLERLFAFAGANGDRAIECDSESDGGRDAIPRTRIEVVHSTFIGNPTSNNPTVKIREGASGVIALSIITDASENGVGVELTDCSPSQRNSATSIFPTVPRQEAFYFDPSNVINATLDFRIDETCANESLSVSKLGALRLRLLPDSPTEMSRMIDPRPMDSISGPYRTKDTWMTAAFATTGPFSLSTKTFNIDNYNGAFDSSLWLDSWSMLSASGMLPADEYTGDPERLLCGFIITSRTLSVGTYYMTCQVFVKRPAILTIPAGTTIKAYAQDAKGRAPALIIQQGAKIMAEGTINAPITFTSVKPPFLLPSRGNWGTHFTINGSIECLRIGLRC
uniref:G8 domain-containing protein n=1 Tax=Lotharella globosa TaxID=91324 RepID=A0A7S3ZB07_9EUKA